MEPNEFGVLKDRIIVEKYNDRFISYEIRKANYGNEDYFSCSVTVSGFGIYSGFSGPCTITDKSSYEKEIQFIKTFIERELKNSETGISHIKKMKLFQTQKQLSFF
jgi:hypothetical protein